MNRLQPIDFHTLKAMVPISQVLDLYDWTPNAVRKGGAELRGKCPIHGSKSDTSKIFSVSAERNSFKCFSCDAGGNQFDLAAHYFGLSMKTDTVRVAVALCKQLGLEIPRCS